MEREKCIRAIHICPTCKQPKVVENVDEITETFISLLQKGKTLTEITDGLICKKDVEKIRKMLTGKEKETVEMLIKENRNNKRKCYV